MILFAFAQLRLFSYICKIYVNNSTFGIGFRGQKYGLII